MKTVNAQEFANEYNEQFNYIMGQMKKGFIPAMMLEAVEEHDESIYPDAALEAYYDATFRKTPVSHAEKAAFMFACDQMGLLD